MGELQEHLSEMMKDPEFAAEYERQEPEREYIRAMIAAHTKSDNRKSTSDP